LALQSGIDESWHDHAIVAHLPWPNDVEKPPNRDSQAIFLAVGEGEEFVDSFSNLFKGNLIFPSFTFTHTVIGSAS